MVLGLKVVSKGYLFCIIVLHHTPFGGLNYCLYVCFGRGINEVVYKPYFFSTCDRGGDKLQHDLLD